MILQVRSLFGVFGTKSLRIDRCICLLPTHRAAGREQASVAGSETEPEIWFPNHVFFVTNSQVSPELKNLRLSETKKAHRSCFAVGPVPVPGNRSKCMHATNVRRLNYSTLSLQGHARKGPWSKELLTSSSKGTHSGHIELRGKRSSPAFTTIEYSLRRPNYVVW